MERIRRTLGAAARRRLLYRVLGRLWKIYEVASGLVATAPDGKKYGNRYHRSWEASAFFRIAGGGGFEKIKETEKTHGLGTYLWRALTW